MTTIPLQDETAQISLGGVGETLAYFRGSGPSLWATDGSVAGTRRLHESESSIEGCVVAGDRCYFIVDGVPQTLWVSEGTPSTTRRLMELPASSRTVAANERGVVLERLEAVLGRRTLLFADAMAGTLQRLVIDSMSAEQILEIGGGWLVAGFLNGDSKLLFVRDEDVRLLADLCQTCDSPRFYRSGARVLVLTDDGELTLTDLTAQGTFVAATNVHSVATGRGEVLFGSGDSVFRVPPGGEPVLLATGADLGGSFSEGVFGLTPEGAVLGVVGEAGSLSLWLGASDGSLRRIYDQPPRGASVDFGPILASESAVFFSQNARVVTKLWSFDGRTSRQILRIGAGGCSEMTGLLGVAGDRALISCDNGGPPELWGIGVEGDVERLLSGEPVPGRSFAAPVVQGQFLLANRDGIYRSDGTAAGTEQVGALSLGSDRLALASGDYGFVVSNTGPVNAAQIRIYRTDLTGPGTEMVADFTGNALRDPVATPDGTLWFVQNGTVFRTDPGSPSGVAVGPGQRFTSLAWGEQFVTVVGENRLVAYDRDGGVTELGSYDRGLHRSGLVALPDLFLFRAGDSLFRAVDSAGNGVDLVLNDARSPSELTVVGDRVFFNAISARYGQELWVTDGTPEGTRLAHDLWPGISSSRPAGLRAQGTRLFFAADDGLMGRELFMLDTGAPACEATESAVCLNGGRFRVETTWVDFSDTFGRGQAASLTDDTAAFWFFDPANVELVVKVLDGTSINGNFWVFSGALSDVHYTVTVADAQTGQSRRYRNPRRNFGSFGDVSALGASLLGGVEQIRASSPAGSSQQEFAEPRVCSAGPQTLCLNGGRFQVDIDWQTGFGTSGRGQAARLTEDTGSFWFFDPENVEVVVKVLDARGVNGRFWVFYGSLSSVAYQMTVTDTVTGAVKVYRNETGTFASAGDTQAF
ncbi:MAG: hypothetical protein AAGK22_29125 [Acidobacteriota bacterium]